MAYFLTVLALASLAVLFGTLLFGRDDGSLRKPVDWTRRVLSGQIPYEKAVIVLAKWIAPLWIVLILLVLGAIFHLFVTLGAIGPDGLRFHYLAIGSMILALGGLIGAPLAIIRVWTGERQTHTIEQGHVTDRLTKAIEQLGAEKTVKRTITREDGTTYVDESTAPNIEVRLGAIYALERIAQDSERDHIPVMETLCAYVRENAKAADAKDHDLGDWPDYPVAINNRGMKARLEQLEQRQLAMGDWLKGLPGPRVDVQTALTVIGQRSPNQISLEKERGKHGDGLYRLDLQRTDLRQSNLSNPHLDNANLSSARMEKANLRAVRMQGAWLIGAKMEGARLDDARMAAANLTGAGMERAILKSARLEGANLSAARMQEVDLREAHLSDAKLISTRLEAAELAATRLKARQLLNR